jgi:hypothetical protein
MDRAPGVLIVDQRVQRSAPAPRLRLLIDWDPRHRVFFRNLADLLLSRRVPQIKISSPPAAFWHDVFVPSGAPWTSFLESMLWHVLVTILFVWGQSRVWVPTIPLSPRTHRSITYYPLTKANSFPASESRASSRTRPRAKQKLAPKAAHQPAMAVTPQQKPALVTPPDIKQATAKLPDLASPHAVTPMVPFSATAGPQRNALADPAAVVAPPPAVNKDFDQTRRMALPQASVVAPAPEINVNKGVAQATARRMALPQASVVAPAPELGEASTGRVAKAPNTGGLRVVAPPPSVQNAGNPTGDRRITSGLPGGGANVVPPPPSVQVIGHLGGAGRLAAATGAGSPVVPPPPSVQGSGGLADGTRLGSLSGTEVVPPPPSVEGAGNSGMGGRLGSGNGPGAGSQIVPPPPSVESAGNSGASGRLGSLSGSGSPIVASPPPVRVTGNYGGGGPKVLEPMDPLPVPASSIPGGNDEDKATFEELPLGLLGVVFAAPGTSYFSNFEVFVAKRRVAKDRLQLIKLVYEFLPYQRRLSEYDLNNLPPRVIKLRVTPDPSCDESLGQMLQSPTDPVGPATYSKLPAALRSSDLNAVMPCYRTTADDFQKAMSKSH